MSGVVKRVPKHTDNLTVCLTVLCAGLLLIFVCLACARCAEQDASDSGDAAADRAALDEATSGNDGGSDLDDLGNEVEPEGWEPEGSTLVARLDTYLDENFSTTGVPGVAVAVVDSEGVRYLRTLGDCPSADAPFVVGSLSKSFTALAIMQLVEEGAINLDAPASLYAPDYDVSPDVTVRNLLNQTSGFDYYASLSDASVGDTYGSFSYANANYDLLGRIVEHVSGEEYASYLDKHVLAPLGMSSSSADPARATELGMTPGHRSWFGMAVADGFVHDSGDEAWGSSPSGYVAASVDDMARYLQMYLRKGVGETGVQALSPAGVTSMFFDRVPDPDSDTYYGMGWTSFYWDDGELVLSHDGQVENYVASMCLLPERDLGVVILGDANDSAGGNTLFFELVSGVVGLAVGATPDPIDRSWVDKVHQHTIVQYASALACCLLPILSLPLWRKRLSDALGEGEALAYKAPLVRLRTKRYLLASGILVHGVVPAVVLALPFIRGISWRDLSTFAPDAACVLVAGASLLVAAGLVKLVVLSVLHGKASRRA